MEQPSDQLRELCGLFCSHDAYNGDATRVVWTKQMVDNCFANRTRLTHCRFYMHEQTRPSIDFDHCASRFMQRSTDVFRHDIDAGDV